MLKFKQEDLVL